MPAGDRVSMEAELELDELRLLLEMCRSVGVPRERWHLAVAISRLWEMLAHGRVWARLRDDGLCRTTARRIAAVRLGLDPATIESRQRQWPQRADKRANG
jgi:hypothetical protein